jgi:hypothetical protein
VKTLIKNLPCNRTTFVEHQDTSDYSIITKEKAAETFQEANSYDINIKNPLRVCNALPIGLRVRFGTPNKSGDLLAEEVGSFEESSIKRGEYSNLNCFNLVDTIKFEVNLDYGGGSATSERF